MRLFLVILVSVVICAVVFMLEKLSPLFGAFVFGMLIQPTVSKIVDILTMRI